MGRQGFWRLVALTGAVAWVVATSFAAETPSVKLTMQFKPVHKDVEIDNPDPKDYDQCKVQVERQGKVSGWVVLGPGGQPIRRFVDTNADNVVDQWRYYHNGVEVYRDIDANYNNKVDQFRWLNHAGTRWGLDANEDGKVDTWKVLSAEELSREAVQALVTKDVKLLQSLLVSSKDLKDLGITGKLADKILEQVASPEVKLEQAISKSKLLGPKTKWMRFDGSLPGVVPADQVGAKADVAIYENVMAIVETGDQPGLIHVGELVRVGDAWKLTHVPQPVEGASPQIAAGGLFIPSFDTPNPGAGTTAATDNPQLQKLIEQMQELEQKAPAAGATRATLAKYNAQRADILEKLRAAADTAEEREQWTRQLVDGITAAVQTGSYAEGLPRLAKLQDDLQKARSPLAAYVGYRRLLAEYSIEMQKAESNEAREKLQERWLKDLEEFVKAYPKAEDSADALLQLGMTQEFNGKLKLAQEWYSQLVRTFPDTSAAKRGQGALYRLDLKGKPLDFRGASLAGGTISAAEVRGKVLLLYFWATWCKPCTDDLPEIRALYEQYHGQGFEIVGVNLDSVKEEIAPYLKEHRVTWPQIHEEGGMESPPAQAFGIISLPTMILADQTGKVLSRNVSAADLKGQLAELVK